tara:strand:- start:232 stop:762 length:531 start_codon:yes stop_codon:yes gene_type:complete
MRQFKRIKNKGILFWITGLSGSGKTQIGKKIKKYITKDYGPTVLFSGDDIRNIFNLKKYTFDERMKIVMQYNKLCKNIVKQNINVIFCVVGLMHRVRAWNKYNIPNYLEIYIKSSFNIVRKKSKKIIYKKKSVQNVVGLDIKPQFPKNPHIIIRNYFDKNLDVKAKELISKIKKII